MLVQLGRYVINCPYIGVWRCYINETLDWEPEDCRYCEQCVSFIELPEARLKQEDGGMV